VSERVSKQVSERVSEWVSEQVSDRVSEWVSKRVSEWVSEWASEWASKQVSDLECLYMERQSTLFEFQLFFVSNRSVGRIRSRSHRHRRKNNRLKLVSGSAFQKILKIILRLKFRPGVP